MSGRGGRSVHVCSPSSRRVVVELSGPGGHLRGTGAILGARGPFSGHGGRCLLTPARGRRGVGARRPFSARMQSLVSACISAYLSRLRVPHRVTRLASHLDSLGFASRIAFRFASHLGLHLGFTSRLGFLLASRVSLALHWPSGSRSCSSSGAPDQTHHRSGIVLLCCTLALNRRNS